MITYLHPISAAFALALLAYVGMLGLRARSDRRRRRELLQRHSRLAPVMNWMVLVSWPLGAFTTWNWRSDLELAESAHFRIGVALVVALIGSWITSRRISHPSFRSGHPWFGIAAMLLAAAQVFFGLQITP